MTITIHHIACWTEDLDRFCAFYENYFDAVINPPYHNPKKGLTTRFLEFPGGGKIEVMYHPDIQRVKFNQGEQHIGYIHLAFSTGSHEKVDALTNRLQADGFKIVDGPRATGDGFYESSVLDPDGNRVEITI